MDPITAIGAVAASLQLLMNLQQTAMRVAELYEGISHVHENTQSLRQEMESFQFILVLVSHEIEKCPAAERLALCWNDQSMISLLRNAKATLSQLERLLEDINRYRSVAARLREYYRSQNYASKINALRLRLNTHVSALNIAVLTLSSRNIESNITGQSLYLKVLLQRVDSLSDSISRIDGSRVADPINPPPLDGHTPPATSSERTSITCSPRDPHSPDETAFAKEGTELVDLARDMVASVKSVAATLSCRSETPAVRENAGATPTDDFLHVHADILSLKGVPLPRRSRDDIVFWVDGVAAPDDVTLERPLSPSASLSGGSDKTEVIRHASDGQARPSSAGVPETQTLPETTPHESADGQAAWHRKVFTTQLDTAKSHISRKSFAKALAHLDQLLQKAKSYSFTTENVVDELLQLAARSLVELNLHWNHGDRLIREHPAIVGYLVPDVLVTAKRRVEAKEYTAAIRVLQNLLKLAGHSSANSSPDSSVVPLPEDVSRLMAHCLVDNSMTDEAATNLAQRYQSVDLHLTRLWSTKLLKADLTMDTAPLTRIALAGWGRCKARGIASPADQVIEDNLRHQLAMCIINDRDPESEEARTILRELVTSSSASGRIRIIAHHLLAFSYLYTVETWELAKEHAATALQLYQVSPPKGWVESDFILLLHQACVLLGNPEAEVYEQLLPSVLEQKTRLAWSEMFHAIKRHIRKVGNVDRVKAGRTAVVLLKRLYGRGIISLSGKWVEPCWDCVAHSVQASRGSFMGEAPHMCPAANGECAARYPIFEFLVCTTSLRGSNTGCWLEIDDLLSDTDPAVLSWGSKYHSIIIRLAIVNGRSEVVRVLLKPSSKLTDDPRARRFDKDLFFDTVPNWGQAEMTRSEFHAICIFICNAVWPKVAFDILTCVTHDSIWDLRIIAQLMAATRATSSLHSHRLSKSQCVQLDRLCEAVVLGLVSTDAPIPDDTYLLEKTIRLLPNDQLRGRIEISLIQKPGGVHDDLRKALDALSAKKVEVTVEENRDGSGGGDLSPSPSPSPSFVPHMVEESTSPPASPVPVRRIERGKLSGSGIAKAFAAFPGLAKKK